jgi:hypothetical protein
LTTSCLFVADTHIGSSVALCKPGANLDDGGTYQLSKGQRWLWRNWETLLAKVEQTDCDELYTFLNGDLAEMDAKGRSYQLITPNTANIKALAADIFDPLAKMSAGLFVLRGTMAHAGKSAEAEETIARDLGAVQCPETGASSWWGLRWQVEGVRFDIAHHPPGSGGGRPMNSQSMIDRLASDTLFNYANAREPLPHLVIRAHIHQHKDSRDAFAVRAVTLPAWTLATEYVHRIAPHALADIGAVLVHCSAGHYEVEPVRFTPDKTPFYSIGELQVDHD